MSSLDSATPGRRSDEHEKSDQLFGRDDQPPWFLALYLPASLVVVVTVNLLESQHGPTVLTVGITPRLVVRPGSKPHHRYRRRTCFFWLVKDI